MFYGTRPDVQSKTFKRRAFGSQLGLSLFEWAFERLCTIAFPSWQAPRSLSESID